MVLGCAAGGPTRGNHLEARLQEAQKAYATALLLSEEQERGLYGRAEPLYVRALAIREAAFGKNHPDVAGSLNSLPWARMRLCARLPPDRHPADSVHDSPAHGLSPTVGPCCGLFRTSERM
nr:tetratricopeptide repeat protein [Corallococcus llansteffanensis]